MKTPKYFPIALAGAVLIGAATLVADTAKERYMAWEVHDPNRPQPPVVDSGHPGTQDATGKAPSDAIVLFDGSSLDAWDKGNGQPVGWEIKDGSMVRIKRAGSAFTKQAFGDIQLHLEFKVPELHANDKGQKRGNSGIFFMRTYELQVLDSKDNETYPDGMAGSIYGQFPPLVNPGRGIEKW